MTKVLAFIAVVCIVVLGFFLLMGLCYGLGVGAHYLYWATTMGWADVHPR